MGKNGGGERERDKKKMPSNGRRWPKRLLIKVEVLIKTLKNL
jgi:hypothetical protein